MSDGTHIEWTDATWNIITGCSVVSEGCKHCYAMKLAGTRLRNDPSRQGLTIDTKAGPVWNGQVRFNEKWLRQPLQWKRPRRIFVCAHGDLFHENVPDEWIDKVFAVMALCPHHTFQVLTKRPERMLAWATHDTDGRWGFVDGRARQIWREHSGKEFPPGKMLPFKPLPNVWLGVSVENQKAADERIPLLLETPAAVRFLSVEPLLGPLDLRALAYREGRMDGMPCTLFMDALSGFRATSPVSGQNGTKVDWVIVGGESGPGARPMNTVWVRKLRDTCKAAGVAFFFKQWGAWADGVHAELEKDKEYRVQFVEGNPMYQVGKKAAGRKLDGIEHSEYPK